jgi:hypothetical protein
MVRQSAATPRSSVRIPITDLSRPQENLESLSSNWKRASTTKRAGDDYAISRLQWLIYSFYG